MFCCNILGMGAQPKNRTSPISIQSPSKMQLDNRRAHAGCTICTQLEISFNNRSASCLSLVAPAGAPLTAFRVERFSQGALRWSTNCTALVPPASFRPAEDTKCTLDALCAKPSLESRGVSRCGESCEKP